MTELARTIFLGNGAFAVPIVSALAEYPSVDLIAVVAAPTRRGSRGRPTDPPVADWAEARRVPMLRPARLRDPESITAIADLHPDLLVLADYGQIVPATLLGLPRHGALNLHPSLLPRYRGASPIPATILEGDAETGVSLMLMDSGLDTGPVIAQSRVGLSGAETAPQLEDELARDGAHLLIRTLDRWLAGEIDPQPQDASRATKTRPLRRDDGLLDPGKTGAELERQVRAYQPWPGSFIKTNAGRLIVWQAHISPERKSLPSGRQHRTPDGGLGLITADQVLELDEVQLASGRRMRGTDLLRGHPALRFTASPEASEGSSA